MVTTITVTPTWKTLNLRKSIFRLYSNTRASESLSIEDPIAFAFDLRPTLISILHKEALKLITEMPAFDFIFNHAQESHRQRKKLTSGDQAPVGNDSGRQP